MDAAGADLGLLETAAVRSTPFEQEGSAFVDHGGHLRRTELAARVGRKRALGDMEAVEAQSLTDLEQGRGIVREIDQNWSSRNHGVYPAQPGPRVPRPRRGGGIALPASWGSFAKRIDPFIGPADLPASLAYPSETND